MTDSEAPHGDRGADSVAREAPAPGVTLDGPQIALQAAILDSVDLAFIACDVDGTIRAFNGGATRLLGYAAAEVVDRSTPAIFHDPAEIVARAAALGAARGTHVAPGFDVFVLVARETAAPDEHEWTYIRKDGSRLPVRLSVTPLRSPDGGIVGYLGVAQDLTKRREAERFAEQLMEHAPNALFLVDAGARIVRANPRAAALFGYPLSDLVGRLVHDLVPHASRPQHTGLVAGFLVAGQAMKMGARTEFAALRRDGSQIFVEIGLAPVPTADGPAVLVSAVDMTARRAEALRAETQLAVMRSLSQAVDEGAAIHTTLSELGTRLEWASAAFWRLAPGASELELADLWCARPRPDLTARSLASRLAPGAGLPTSAWDVGRAVWTRALPFDASYPRAREALACGLQSLALFRVEVEGELVGVIELGGDRPRPRDEAVVQMMESIGAALGQFLLRRRTETALVRAKRAAELASEAKSLFVANMSHEIRTPMNAVLGLTHLALKTELTPRQHSYLTKISASASSLLGIINDILDFAKLEADKLRIDHVPFDLDVVLATLADAVAVLVGTKEIEVVFDVAPDVPRRLVGDPLRLQQVLLNLCANAVKFTPAGEVLVAIRTRPEAERRLALVCKVIDTGIGMSAEVAAPLFQAFVQADASTTRKYGGTGLGLSICKRLVGLMGGRIEVRSRPGAGSTFEFSVAVERDPSAATTEPRSVPAGLRTLVVDDNESSRLVLAGILSGFHLRVDSSPDGPSAIDAYDAARERGEPYDLVIVDWKMPGMDGLEVARRILGAGSARPPPPVIMATGFSDDELLTSAEDVGVRAVITKPVSASTLFDAVVLALGRPPRIRHDSVAPRGIPAELRGARVLLVEDNDINRQIAVELLEQAGAIVVCAEDGRAALDLASPDFDAVLMDLQMPVMDGFEATRQWLANADLARVPIIAMTANALHEDRDRVFAAGMRDFVAKPVDPAHLYATVARWVGARARGSSRPAGPRDAAPPRSDRRPHGVGDDGRDPDLPGIDITPALRHVGGNKSLLTRLLLRFRDSERDSVDRIERAIASGDRVAAVRAAHTLKGLAATLGAGRVARSAAEVEAALTTGSRHDAPIERLRGALDVVLRGLARIGPAPELEASAPAPAELDPATREALERASSLLATYDTEAIELLNALSGRVPHALQALFGEARACAAEFEFDDARARVDAMLKPPAP